MTIHIFVEEIDRSGRYRAALDNGTELVKSSRQPFFDAARVLLRRGEQPEFIPGHDPGTVLVMVRRTTGTESLRGRLGDVATLTVDETRPRYLRWRPHPRSQDAPPSRPVPPRND